ncbi:hypothetical protein DSM106972_046900 [Dulcicalothrix desertica PCC 7102]|uniref:Uncharacterized protein n=1 Tax=Dulcicalothrix desertica PCC 7102 TaxID=232991 RepID=A0A433VEC0_9CYAN|nr:hypothetical protein [Dulcicalothrix desertica]RUT04462.1 hypothetical protein DSM106972_046900 [Dulcicalothrix desertica PCC 7102]TWH51310.1 hypothetical protein CAL7102_05713 [Dulcicalothrix desertica PCC 7102]
MTDKLDANNSFTKEHIRLLSRQLDEMYKDMKAERREIALWEEEQEFSILGVMELFSTDIQGYAEQAILNTSDVSLNSKNVNHLRQLNVFNIDYFTKWYFQNLEMYPQTQKYVEQLDHLRLLLIDYLGSSSHS